MPRRVFDDAVVDRFLRAHERIATHDQLRELGMPGSTITSRIRPNGPWQRGLPGVVIAHRGSPTRRERLLVALAYGGPGSIVTGRPALRLQDADDGARKGPEIPYLLVPHECRRTSHHFVVVQRTRYLPTPRIVNGIPVAPQPRALADATRRENDLDAVRGLVSHVVQGRAFKVADLAREVGRLARQRSACLREALREVDDGVRSVAEAKAREVALAAKLGEELMFNPTLWTPDGELICSPDGYVQRLAAGYEIDSFAYHLGRASYLHTQRRTRRVLKHGVLTVGFSPVDILDDPVECMSDFRGLLAVAADRAIPDIIVQRAR